MNRHKILQLTGTSFATGIDVKGVRGRQEDGTDDGEQEEEETEKCSCEVDIQFGERELIIDETGFSPRAFAKIGVENVGEAPSGRVSITAARMGENGNFFDEDSTELSSIGAGETWSTYVEAFAIDPDEIDGFEISGEFDIKYP